LEEEFHKALKYSFLLLRYRDRSEKELLQRLGRKSFSDETGRQVVGYLKEKGFIDDERLAGMLKRTAVDQKKLGKRGVVNYLMSRGIPAEIIDGVSGEDGDYTSAAESFVSRKMKQMRGLDEATVRRRLWGALARKGFSPDIIRKVMRPVIPEEVEL